MKNLDRIVTECKADIENLDIELGHIIKVSVNTRAKRRWGQCRKTPTGYEISISDRLLADDVDEWATKNTVAHELLHTIKGGNGHTGAWKTAAEKLNRAYGYTIKRCTSSEEKGIESEPITVRQYTSRYFIQCSKCNKTYTYYKKSKVVRYFMDYPEKARQLCKCGRCKSHNTLSLVNVQKHY